MDCRALLTQVVHVVCHLHHDPHLCVGLRVYAFGFRIKGLLFRVRGFGFKDCVKSLVATRIFPVPRFNRHRCVAPQDPPKSSDNLALSHRCCSGTRQSCCSVTGPRAKPTHPLPPTPHTLPPSPYTAQPAKTHRMDTPVVLLGVERREPGVRLSRKRRHPNP